MHRRSRDELPARGWWARCTDTRAAARYQAAARGSATTSAASDRERSSGFDQISVQTRSIEAAERRPLDGGSGGATPYGGKPVFDRAGNLFGTAYSGGGGNCSGGCGLVYELSPSQGGWTQTVLYRFAGGPGDGAYPWAGVTFDQTGNLYGTTQLGGAFGYGTIYKLSPSGSGWTETVLYNFQRPQDGGWPYAGLLFDTAGNLYGATTIGGAGDGGARDHPRREAEAIDAFVSNIRQARCRIIHSTVQALSRDSADVRLIAHVGRGDCHA